MGTDRRLFGLLRLRVRSLGRVPALRDDQRHVRSRDVRNPRWAATGPQWHAADQRRQILTSKFEAAKGDGVHILCSAAGRALSAVDSANGINYATAALYAPWGALSSLKYGVATGFNGIVNTNTYNKRLQPLLIEAQAPSQTVLSLTYNFGAAGANNGNVMGITNNRDAFRALVGSASYTYDALNRIATPSPPAPTAPWSTGTARTGGSPSPSTPGGT